MEATPVAHNAEGYRGFALAQLRILSDYCKRYKLNIASRKVVLNNGVVITCSYCWGKQDVWISIHPVTVGARKVVDVETFGVFIHPRQGDVELLTHYEWEQTGAGPTPIQKRLSHGVAGGWGNGVTPLTTKYVYPLVDEDNASYLLESTSAEDTDITGSFARALGNYGNLYWYNGDADNPVLLSWKGTPTRHFRLAGNVQIDGFTIQETATPGAIEDMPIFTSFGTKIYQSGNVLAEAPRWNWPYSGQDRCLILGAMQDIGGVLWAVMQSDRYNVPKHIVYFSDGYRMATDDDGAAVGYLSSHSGVTISFEKHYPTKLGIYTMLWKQGGPVDGWSFVGEWNTGRQGIPWFGNAAGTEFVNPAGDHITVGGNWSDSDLSATGAYAETIRDDDSTFFGTGSISASFQIKDFFEFVGGNLAWCQRVLVFHSDSYRTDTPTEYKVFEGPFKQIYNPDNPAEVPLPFQFLMTPYSTVLAVVGQPFIASAYGGQGEYSYSYSGFTVGEDGLIASVSNCGTGTAVGSVTVTDACGDSITREIRLQGGAWVVTEYLYATCTDPNCSSTPCRFSQGGSCGYFWAGWGTLPDVYSDIKALYDQEYIDPSTVAGGSYTTKAWRWPSNSTTTSDLGNTATSNGMKWLVVEQVTNAWRCP